MRLLVALVFFVVWSSAVLHAETLDPSFSEDGRYLYGEFGTYDFRAVTTLPLPQGRTVSVFQFPLTTGFCNQPRCIGLKLFDANGNLERVGTFPNDVERVTAAAIDGSGRIIVTAQTTAGASGRDLLVARFNADTLTRDLRFGNSTGWVRLSYNSQDEFPASVAVDNQDRIVVAGSVTFSATDTDYLFVRLLSNGALDATFNGTGMRAVAFDLTTTLRLDQANAVTVTPKGRILAIGNVLDSSVSRIRIGIVRLNADGSFDTSLCPTECAFNAGYSTIRQGRTIYLFGAQTTHADEGLSIDALGMGGYVIAGATYADNGSNRRGALARFGDTGEFLAERVGISLGDNGIYRSIKAVDANGTRVLVAGNSGPGDNFLLLQAFDTNLVPVPNYGDCHLQNNGFCPIFSNGLADWGPDAGVSIAVDAGGRPLVYAQGIASDGGLPALMTLRYTNTAGRKPDTIFRTGFN